MKEKMLLMVIVSLISCNSSTQGKKEKGCQIDYEFRSKFQNCIEIMALREIGYKVRFVYTADAYYCLLGLTGHKSPIDAASDTPLYYPGSDDTIYFVEDFKAWSRWYEKNKCTMSMAIADSILKANDYSWPPSLTEVTLSDSSYVGY